MYELNISTYIQIMRKGFINNDGQEAAGKFLLDSINKQQYVCDHGYYSDIGSKKISQLVSQSAPVPDGIKKASQIDEVIREALAYFETKVVADLNPHLKDDTLEKLATVVQQDAEISSAKREFLLSLYHSNMVGRFLGETFLYVLNRDNKKAKDDNTVDYQDAPLLAEVNYECPINHSKLIETVKGVPVKHYAITTIFPEGLDEEQEAAFSAVYPRPADLYAPSNLIALCSECSARYLLNPTVEEYAKLYELKARLAKSYAASIAINRVDLEEEIRTILSALMTISPDTELVELEYSALRIDQKFLPENFILKLETQQRVLHYYRYIESVFSQSDADFDLIASEIKVSSTKLEKSGMSQEEVITHLVEWIRNKAQLGNGKNSTTACQIVVAFFIQNCEVFHK